jgi:hypothetical protein
MYDDISLSDDADDDFVLISPRTESDADAEWDRMLPRRTPVPLDVLRAKGVRGSRATRGGQNARPQDEYALVTRRGSSISQPGRDGIGQRSGDKNGYWMWREGGEWREALEERGRRWRVQRV